jgi:hypothetical protein
MKNVTTNLLMLVLVAVSLILFAYKVRVLEFPLAPNKQYESWYVEMRMRFQPDYSLKSDLEEPTDKPVRLEMQLPRQPENLAMVEEQFVSDGWGRDVQKADDGTRSVVFTKRKTDRRELLYYRTMLYKLDSPEEETSPVKAPVAKSPYNLKLHPDLTLDAKQDPVLMAVQSLILEAKETAADKHSLIQSIWRIALKKGDDRHRLIMTKTPDAKTESGLAVLLLQAANIPARLVHGVALEGAENQSGFLEWVEVWYKEKWRPIDPETQHLYFRTPHLPWWIGSGSTPYTLAGGHALDTKLSVKKNTDNAITRALWKSGKMADVLLRFSLFNLPVGTQLLFQVLLMIPIGGLLIAFLRQVVGVKTFGTFMPVLVALAFRETGLMTGIVTFVLIVVLGLIIRSWFHKLQLLMVPRLAAVLTIVVMLIGVITLMAENLGIRLGLSIALFPIVILTMTIERMSVMWDESGSKDAIKIGMGSLICAIFSYFVMTEPLLVHLIFTFPELLLIVLALCILLGRYNGYKLTEYRRFKKLHQQIQAQESGTSSVNGG